jgi:ATP-dependent helicase/nuclease subunit A
MNNNIIPGDLEARKIVLNVLNKNLLVEAVAGSGKTTILIDRIVALLKKKEMEIGQLAAITFTRKAAAEMRERLQLRLEKEVIDSGNEAIVKALTNLNQAYVGTIHSFCAKLLRSRPVEANIDPAFEEFDKLMASINRTSEKVCSGTEDFKIYTKKREYFPAPYHKSQWCASRKRELA